LHFDDSSLRGIARLNRDGTPERTFAPDANGTVHAIALQPDGKILLGGDFGRVSGQPRKCLARLNTDGSPDTSFNPGGVFNHEVRAVLVQPDGKILVGGSFNANRQNRLTRLNPDGTKDASFDSGGANRIVWALALQRDGKILVGGGFTSFDDHPQGRLVRLNPDGTVDTTFACGSGTDEAVLALCVQPDGKILVAGDFTTLNNAPSPHIARLLPDGTADATFNPGAGANKSIRSLAIQPDGKVVIAGTFQRLADTPRNGIARLNANGSLDQTFDPGEGAGGGAPWRVALQADGRVLLAGGFTNLNGVACGRIARLYAKN
jgi:uncharacterized delta-60 repeat protein